MKGLLINDFYCSRNIIKTFFFIILLCCLSFLLLLLGGRYGNLRELDPDGTIVVTLSVIFDMFVPLFAGLCGYMTLSEKFAADGKGWNKYLFSLPVSDKARLGTVFIISASVSLSVFVITLGMSAVFHAVAGDLSIEVLSVPVTVYIAAFMFSFVQTTVLYILKSRWKTTVFGFALYFIIGWAFSIYVIIKDDGEELFVLLTEIINLFGNNLWLAPVVLIITAASSYFISLQAMKRRDKLMY